MVIWTVPRSWCSFALLREPKVQTLMAWLPTSDPTIRTYTNAWNLIISFQQNTHTHTNTQIHIHSHFAALWILSGTTRVSRYQKKHSPTHTIVVINHPYLLPPSTTIHGIFPQSTCFTVFFLLANCTLILSFSDPSSLKPNPLPPCWCGWATVNPWS